MSLFGKKKKAQDTGQEYRAKDFFDCILPGSIKFFANYYIVGDTYVCHRPGFQLRAETVQPSAGQSAQ